MLLGRKGKLPECQSCGALATANNQLYKKEIGRLVSFFVDALADNYDV